MKKEILFVFSLCLLLIAGCKKEPYKDTSLSAQERAEDLVARLTLEEKALLTMDVSAPVERLGIKPYNWWNEALHGIARAGLATVFPQPIGLAATFDEDMLYRMFEAVSDEGRAKHVYAASQGSYQRYQGVTMWTPTINIFRDPRWGRGIETYGEDPYLTAVMGVSAVKGLQGPKDGKYDKLHACAKHFAVHSGPEWNRHSFDAENISPRDLCETYLPAFEALIKDAGVKEVMCAYNRYEGDPCCGSNRLLVHILREEWGFDGVVVADCGAIADFYRENAHKTHPDAASASADAVRAGTDLDCGSSYKALVESVQKGFLSEEELDVSVVRLLRARFELGEMDELKDASWNNIPYSVVASQKHDELALETARKSMTLLLNKNQTLPLQRGGLTVAVMGPNANDSVMQWGNYSGTPPRTITILEGIRAALGTEDKLIYEPGCSWVERKMIKSVFDQCSTEQGPGFTARYWNNLEHEGEPVTVTQVTTPFRFCTMGATVFAPGVNLSDFSATYSSIFTPQESGEVVFEFYAAGATRVRVDGEEVWSSVNRHGSRPASYTMMAEAGKPYALEIDYEYYQGDAQLNFDLGIKQDVDIAGSVARVKEADVVIFVGGISPGLEGEEMGVNLPGFKKGDRTDIELPAVQRELIQALNRAGKKVILVNCSGSPIGLEPEVKNCQAILQAWYPGQAGGKAVAEVLFGDYNPSGRLPVTFYRNLSQVPDFEDYTMTNRTYRYMKEASLFPFGYGLSYTSFAYDAPTLSKESASTGESVTLKVPVTNTGSRDGDEIVQVYLRRTDDPQGPVKALRAFRRVSIPAGQEAVVEMELTPRQFEWWDESTNTMRTYAGAFEILVGGSSQDKDLRKVQLVLQ
ncbi:MAG: glycoside hydrolase family 3 C-terminal domain-containing protein [Bacteroides sp.]|nr:glycoside hydrolase family 3 C-terminal domain-containing protein [Bacteroides sp.]